MTDPFKSICYKRNFLKEVIVRVDLVNPLPGLDATLPTALTELPRIAVIEFGVAGGAGLLSLERCAELVGGLIGIAIEVYGFDTGTGLPKSNDYRDVPYMWKKDYFPMDTAELGRRLQRAQLKLGVVQSTLPDFLNSNSAPAAFISFDLDLYSSTRDALQVLEATPQRLLPRTFCYFDDIVGYGMCEYNGGTLSHCGVQC